MRRWRLYKAQGRVFAEGLIGIANALVECAPLYVMCDVQDIGVVVDSSNLRQGRAVPLRSLSRRDGLRAALRGRHGGADAGGI